MNPEDIGHKYDRLAGWWQARHRDSDYGVAQLLRALAFCRDGGSALDVGCGAGGRLVGLLQQRGFGVTGIDVSAEMVRLARLEHPQHDFVQHDIGTWESERRFDLVFAWDSIFHLPLAMQQPVVSKLCGLLAPQGVLMYTFGDAHGEHTDVWRGDTFHYSSIGIDGNLRLLLDSGLKVVHLEMDQFPQNHVCVIATRL
ncbi:MAG: class I SAM-dependent methyltransferase [Gammaproteobacteria bacterium]|nr:class I SAM-dependent methyltransferase [Gammaproteobacteria bacterium]